jgi:hypothetical protein
MGLDKCKFKEKIVCYCLQPTSLRANSFMLIICFCSEKDKDRLWTEQGIAMDRVKLIQFSIHILIDLNSVCCSPTKQIDFFKKYTKISREEK